MVFVHSKNPIFRIYHNIQYIPGIYTTRECAIRSFFQIIPSVLTEYFHSNAGKNALYVTNSLSFPFGQQKTPAVYAAGVFCWQGHQDLMPLLLQRSVRSCLRRTGVKELSPGQRHPVFQVLFHAEKTDSRCCRLFLAGALGLEPRAYGFGDPADKSAFLR